MKNKIIEKTAKMFARHLEGLFFAFLEGRISYDEYKDYFQQETEMYIDHLKGIQEQKQEQDKGTEKVYVYEVIHSYGVDGGFGDYVPCEDVIAVFSSEEKADEFVEKYSNPHVYDKPYAELDCGHLCIRKREIDRLLEEKEMWWL